MTFTLAGASSGQGTANADAEAVGVEGDSGEDIVFNDNKIDVDAVTSIDSSGRQKLFLVPQGRMLPSTVQVRQPE